MIIKLILFYLISVYQKVIKNIIIKALIIVKKKFIINILQNLNNIT